MDLGLIGVSLRMCSTAEAIAQNPEARKGPEERREDGVKDGGLVLSRLIHRRKMNKERRQPLVERKPLGEKMERKRLREDNDAQSRTRRRIRADGEAERSGSAGGQADRQAGQEEQLLEVMVVVVWC